MTNKKLRCERKSQEKDGKKRNDLFKFLTVLFILLIIILSLSGILQPRKEQRDENNILCSVIYYTPAWATDGKIIMYGVAIPNENMSIDLIATELLPNNIKMLYSTDCSACKKQIEYFKTLDSWEEYNKRGLVVDCSKFME